MYSKHYNYDGMQTIPTQVFCVEPYFVSTLLTLMGKKLVVETVRGSVSGILFDVIPDHIVIGEIGDYSKFL